MKPFLIRDLLLMERLKGFNPNYPGPCVHHKMYTMVHTWKGPGVFHLYRKIMLKYSHPPLPPPRPLKLKVCSI